MESLGFANAWTNQYEAIPNINVIRVRIRDQFMQHWCSHINNTSKLEYYAMFKTTFEFEKNILNVSKTMNSEKASLVLGFLHII